MHDNVRENVSKTGDTKTKYMLIVGRKMAAFVKDTGFDPHENQDEFIQWLTRYSATLKYGSWRLYRAALVYAFSQVYGDASMAERIRQIHHEASSIKSIKTSASKSRRIDLKSLAAFEDYANETHNALNAPCLMSIKASMLTGARPIEWRGAVIIRDELLESGTQVDLQGRSIHIRFKNAKSTNGRSHGAYRTIVLSGLTDRDVEIIHYMIEYASQPNYKKILTRMSVRVSEINSLLFGRVVGRNGRRKNGVALSLYGARHQFAADAKANGLEPPVIAAMMGHASVDTAYDFYAKGLYGHKVDRFRARPYYSDLESVYHLNDGKPMRVNKIWIDGIIQSSDEKKNAQDEH